MQIYLMTLFYNKINSDVNRKIAFGAGLRPALRGSSDKFKGDFPGGVNNLPP
jgi:hypothetical protein